jgi:acetyl-CoA carboxylase carboxyl transferase subunit alpha
LASLLDFESSLRPLEHELESVRRKATNGSHAEQEERIQRQMDDRLREIYRDLTPWQKVQVARHRERPYTLDYLQWGFTEFVELHGDRSFADDKAIVGGPATLDGRAVMVIGQQKGRDTRENVERNFGMPHPEGYRKAERLMRQAERMHMPVVTLIDIPGASAGLQDEERGQSEAIASCIACMLDVRVPTVAIVIGEGGSGGAMAVACADRLLMLEHSTFYVASPEAAAAILWRDAGKAADAAQNMRITARDLVDLGIVDGIVAEPLGGAHRDRAQAARSVTGVIIETLAELERLPIDELLARRYDKYRSIAFFQE